MSPFSTGIADPRKKTTFAGGISCLLGTARDQREMVNHMAQEEGSASGPGRKGRENVERVHGSCADFQQNDQIFLLQGAVQQ